MTPVWLAIVAAAAMTWALTPVAGWMAQKVGAVDDPEPRRIHFTPIPRLGGVAIAFGFAAALALGVLAADRDAWEARVLAGVMLAALIAASTGIIDDLRHLAAAPKMVGQVAAASVLVWAGLEIDSVPIPFSDPIALGAFSVPVTVIWVVAVMNAINMIDGIDGLAAGIGLIAAGSAAAIGLWVNDPTIAVIGAAMVGALAGFLPHNFHPARIFMGDAGSMLVGLVLAAVGILIGRHPQVEMGTMAAALILGVPILDLLVAVARRLRQTKNPLYPDKEHLHHLLYSRVQGQRTTVLMIYGLGALYGVSAVLLVLAGNHEWAKLLPLIAFPALGLAFLGLVVRMKRMPESEQAEHTARS